MAKLRFLTYLREEAEADSGKKDKEQNTAAQEVTSVCDVGLAEIFFKLHDAAIQKIDQKYKIVNSAIDDKNKKLTSAGEHLISVVLTKGDEKLTKEDAIEPMKQYLQWFAGPDIASTLTSDKLLPLPTEDASGQTSSEGTANSSKEESNPDHKKDAEAAKSESIAIPTFAEYLLLEADPTTAGEDPDGPDQEDVDNANAVADNAAEEPEPSDTATTDSSEEKSIEPDKAPQVGFYLVYNLKIEGQKETKLQAAFAKLKTGLMKVLDNVTVQKFDWKSGAKGKETNLGDAVRDTLSSLDSIFRKIDPKALQTNFTKNFGSKFPQLKKETISGFLSKAEVLKRYSSKMAAKDKIKAKSADNSFYVQVPVTDESRKILTADQIAELVTTSIKGIFKKLKNKLTGDDVITIQNAVVGKQPKASSTSVQNKTTKEAIEAPTAGTSLQILHEEADKGADSAKEIKSTDDVQREMEDYMISQADELFKDYSSSVSAKIVDSKKCIETLKQHGIADKKDFTELSQHQKAYTLVLTDPHYAASKNKKKKQEKSPVSDSVEHLKSDLTSKLFESQLTAEKGKPLTSLIQKYFENIINKQEFLNARGKSTTTKAVVFKYEIGKDEKVVENVIESKTLASYMNALLEGVEISDGLFSNLDEKDTKATSKKSKEKSSDELNAKLKAQHDKFTADQKKNQKKSASTNQPKSEVVKSAVTQLVCVMPDYPGILDNENVSSTSDVYIVPMKGLKMDYMKSAKDKAADAEKETN